MIWVLLVVAALAWRHMGMPAQTDLPIVTLPGGGRVADLDAAIQSGALPTGVFPTSPARFGRSPNVATGGTKIVVDLAGGAR